MKVTLKNGSKIAVPLYTSLDGTVSSSAPAVATASVTNGVLVVQALTIGMTKITLQWATDLEVTLTIYVVA